MAPRQMTREEFMAAFANDSSRDLENGGVLHSGKATASELVKEGKLFLDKAEETLLEELAPYDDPEDVDSYLIGYPDCLASNSFYDPEPATRELLWALYDAAWNKDGLAAAEIFCGAEPDAEPFVIGLYGSHSRELAFCAHPDLRNLSCATKEDLRDLHARLVKATSRKRATSQ